MSRYQRPAKRDDGIPTRADVVVDLNDPRLLPRFWKYVRVTDSGCWEWYGRYGVSDGVKVGSHQWAYEALIGPVTPGLQLDHLCRNPPCCNPAHLEPVTPRENTLRGSSPAARNAQKTHCKRGHPFDAENTRWVPACGGRLGRQCRTCQRDRAREARRKRQSGADDRRAA